MSPIRATITFPIGQSRWEILDGSDHAATGQPGQPVGTSLHSFAAPIIGLRRMGWINLSTIQDIPGEIRWIISELPDGTITTIKRLKKRLLARGRMGQASTGVCSRVRTVQLGLSTSSHSTAVELERDPSISLEQFLNNHAVKVRGDHRSRPRPETTRISLS